ncbi:MAG: hypothetical protein WCJ64_07995 [Rhodospirillaceae bacterium]
MDVKKTFKIEGRRAGAIFNIFNRIHSGKLLGEIGPDECDVQFLDLGNPRNDSMRSDLGYIQDTKYKINLSWCVLVTVTCGEVERYTASVENENGREVIRIIVERSHAGYGGMIYSMRATLEPMYNPEEIISHLIIKDIAE